MNAVHSAATLSQLHSNSWMMTCLELAGARGEMVVLSDPTTGDARVLKTARAIAASARRGGKSFMVVVKGKALVGEMEGGMP